MKYLLQRLKVDPDLSMPMRKKMAEVEEAYQTLEKNHGNPWTLKQLREWATMYQMKEQTSLDVPPSGYLFE